MSRWKGKLLKEFEDMYTNSNVSVEDISKCFGISKARVYNVAREYGFKRYKGILIDSRRNQKCYLTQEERKKIIRKILLKATGIYLD